MPKQARIKSRYLGVYSVKLQSGDTVFFIRYKREHRTFEERAGSQAQGMTAAKANNLRSQRLAGKVVNNHERREQEKIKREEKQKIVWTIGKLFDEYAETRDSNPAKPYKTRLHDTRRFNHHIRPTFGDTRPEDIDHLSLERWKRKLQKGRSPTTVWHCLEILRRAILFGTNHRLCGPTPFPLKFAKPDNKVTEYLDPVALQRLMDAVNQEPPITANLFRFVLLTGLRRSEATKLEWSDVDFEQGEILLRDTKAGKDQTLPLSDAALQLLHGQPRLPEVSFVFPSPQGKRWPEATMNRLYKRIQARADLPEGFRLLHGLRHQYGSMLDEAGASPVEIRDLMRHSDLRVSERYLHSSQDRLRNAANRLGSLLEERTETPEPVQVVRRGV